MSEYRFKKFNWLDLTRRQSRIIKSIKASEVFEVAFAPIVIRVENSIRSVLSHNFKKIRSLIILKEVIYEKRTTLPFLFNWIISILDKIGQQLNFKILASQDGCRSFIKLSSANVSEGAGRRMLEKIKIADTIMAPKLIRRTTLNDEDSNSSIFADTHPSIIVSIGKILYCIPPE